MTRIAWKLSVVAAMLLIGFAYPAHAQTEFLRSNPKFIEPFRAIIQPQINATVRVQCDGKDTCVGAAVGADGWILTKAHDLQGKIVCKLPDGQLCAARLVGVHEPHDLAMLRINAQLARVIDFSDSKHVQPGAWVVSVGASKEPAAVGVVSVATRRLNEAYLGVQIDATDKGLVVQGILKNSAAWKAGLHAKDILLSINGQRLDEIDDLQQIMGELKVGDAITLRVRRAGKEQELKATLQSREQAGDFRSEFQNRLGSDLSSRRSGYSVILQHDSVLKPADCGGPLVDLKGRVIGINISRAGRTETWAIPAEIVQPLLAELKSGRLAPK